MADTQIKTTPWREIRGKRIKSKDEPRIARERQRIELALELAQLRRRRKTTQADLASKLAVSQSSISQLERGQDVHLSTLASYVHGLGGKLELTAVFPDERLPVRAAEPKKQRRARA
jgi:DNA-binding XRE family transcriptional regulator